MVRSERALKGNVSDVRFRIKKVQAQIQVQIQKLDVDPLEFELELVFALKSHCAYFLCQ